MHRWRIVSMFACCGGCHWPISAGEKLWWPIPVPLAVISARRNRGGQWWEFAIVGGGSHVGGVFWGYLRVIYPSTYVGIVFRSVTARIGFSVDSDLHEKSLHRIGSRWSKNHVESDICFCFHSFFFVFHSEWICCPFKNTESDITWWDSHKIGFMLHLKSDLDVLIQFYLDSNLDDYDGIYKDRAQPGRGRRWARASPLRLALQARSSRCVLAARARGSRCSQLLPKIYEFIHDNCKKYMNSYIIWNHICLNSYI